MAMSNSNNPLHSTFEGHISSTVDALVLFEGCLSGQLNHVPRRPHDRERQDLIKSGHVFIYEEHASGIKRWTDGVSWSPSRILGNFLIYRELDKPFPPGEKKRALKKAKKPQQGVVKTESNSRQSVGYPSSASAIEPTNGNGATKDAERALIGSLIDSYPFKADGLVKKTISITYQGVPHHLVSYYSVADVISGRLSTPTKHPALRNLIPRTELIMSQNFRAPIDEVEYGEDRLGLGPIFTHSVPHEYGNHHPGTVLQRALSTPNFHPIGYHGYNPQNAHHYGFQPQAPVQPAPPQYATTMAPSAPGLSYTSQPQGNYALDPSRSSRLPPTAGAIAQEFPRNMPNNSPPRRHSILDANPSAELSSIGMFPPHNQNNFYYGRPAALTGHDHTFPSPRQLKPESEEEAAQQYGIEESGSWQAFETNMDGSADNNYYHSGGGNPGDWSQG